MWEKTIERIKEYHGLDTHNKNNKFAPPLSESEIAKVEKQLKTKLPEQLRAHYLEVGNGGPTGVVPIGNLENLRADQPWQGIDYYVDHFEEYEENVCGLLGIMGCGYANDCYIVTNGNELGSIVTFSDVGGFFYKEADSLIEAIDKVFDEELERFNQVKEAFNRSESLNEIVEELVVKTGMHPTNAVMKVASILGIEFSYDPEALKSIVRGEDGNFKRPHEVTETVRLKFEPKIKEYIASGESKKMSVT